MKKLSAYILVVVSVLATCSIGYSAVSLSGIGCGYKKSKYTASVSNSNPAAEVVSGLSMPGHQQTLFRGIYESNKQFNMAHVIRGIFKDSNWYIGSPVFFGLTQVLTGQWTLDNQFFPTGKLPHKMREYFRVRGILGDVSSLLKCRGKKYFTPREAGVLAGDLMNKVFGNMSKAETEHNYFNIDSGEYYDQDVQFNGFGNNAADFVISSYYDQIAALYGIRTLVFHDSGNRSLDLGFYNFKKNGRLFHNWVDNGEVNTPGYITTDNIIGMQLRTKDRLRAGWGKDLNYNSIDVAVYKYVYKGKTFGLVVDGQRKALCMIQDGEHIRYCSDYWSGDALTSVAPYPEIQGNKERDIVPLLGILNQCDNKCSELQQIYKNYGKSSGRPLKPYILDKITGSKANSKAINFYREGKVIPKHGLPKLAKHGKIKVKSARYYSTVGIESDDVTKAADGFASGHAAVTYMVNSSYLGLKPPVVDKEFYIEWSCSDAPGKVFKHKVPAPAEGTEFNIDCRKPKAGK